MIRFKGEPLESPRKSRRPVTKRLRGRVTKPILVPAVTKVAAVKNGRPRVHATPAEKQRAYRERKKGKS